MNGKLPERVSISPERSLSLKSLSETQGYPEFFVFRRSELETLDHDARSATILSQLCDVLILIEKPCARTLNHSTEPIARCTVFVLELFLRMLESQRTIKLHSTPNDS